MNNQTKLEGFSVTYSSDVKKILDYKPFKPQQRAYSLYKGVVVDYNPESSFNHDYINWCYYMIIDNVISPVILTEKATLAILKDNELGSILAFNICLDRYR